MADNSRKTPLVESLNRFGAKRSNDTAQIQGKSLPAKVVSFTDGVLTASFQVQGYGTLPTPTVGVAMSRYVRLPLQKDDPGVLRSADAVLGGVTGLGTGIAGATLPGNLGALIFEPVASTAWPAPVDPNSLELSGPNGVIIKPLTGTPRITVTTTSITLAVGSHSIVINSSGVTIDGKVFLSHTHSGVTTGAGNTGGVV